MMKLQIFSDIHCESYHDPKKLWEIVTPKAPVAIVAGDIDSRKFELTLTEISSKFKKVFALYGNHEFYHKDISWRPDMTKIPNNVTILNATCEEYRDTLFVGATLWSDFKNRDWFVLDAAKRCINDFHIVSAGNAGHNFTPVMAADTHDMEKAYIKRICQQNRGKKIVVITHFMPSYECVHEKWKLKPGTDTLNHYFAANCDDLIEESEAKVWVCGHTHDAFDKKVRDVRIVCNPVGYPDERNRAGDPYTDKVINV